MAKTWKINIRRYKSDYVFVTAKVTIVTANITNYDTLKS